MAKLTIPFKGKTIAFIARNNLTFTPPKPTNIIFTITDSEGYSNTNTDVGPNNFPSYLPQNLSKVFRYDYNILITSDAQDRLSNATIVRYPPTGEVIFSRNGFFFHETIYFRGRTQQPPTYLEELAKLDQYSKAQYIPDRR